MCIDVTDSFYYIESSLGKPCVRCWKSQLPTEGSHILVVNMQGRISLLVVFVSKIDRDILQAPSTMSGDLRA